MSFDGVQSSFACLRQCHKLLVLQKITINESCLDAYPLFILFQQHIFIKHDIPDNPEERQEFENNEVQCFIARVF